MGARPSWGAAVSAGLVAPCLILFFGVVVGGVGGLVVVGREVLLVVGLLLCLEGMVGCRRMFG